MEAELTLRQVSDRTIEVQIAPIGQNGKPAESPPSDVLIDYSTKEFWQGRQVDGQEERSFG